MENERRKCSLLPHHPSASLGNHQHHLGVTNDGAGTARAPKQLHESRGTKPVSAGTIRAISGESGKETAQGRGADGCLAKSPN